MDNEESIFYEWPRNLFHVYYQSSEGGAKVQTKSMLVRAIDLFSIYFYYLKKRSERTTVFLPKICRLKWKRNGKKVCSFVFPPLFCPDDFFVLFSLLAIMSFPC